jgi:hypothetical protein
VLYLLKDISVFYASYRHLPRVCVQSASTGAPLSRCFTAPLWIPFTKSMGRLGSHWKSRPGTGHSPENETEIQLSDQEKLADDVETQILRTRQELTEIVRVAAHKTLAAIIERAEGAGTSQLADLAYAFACLEGARRGVLPGTPPPPKNSAPAATPPRPPTSSPQPGAGFPPFGDATRTSR